MRGCTGAAAVGTRSRTVAVAVGEESTAAAVREERIDAAAHVNGSGEKVRGVEKGWGLGMTCCWW